MLFSSSLIMGTIISLSSTTWFMAWTGLEINLLSLLPLMKSPKNKYSAEATLKYFMTQALASAILIFSVMLFSNFQTNMFETHLISFPILNLALLMKMGAAPLHFWMQEVVTGISWNLNIIILTWQKLAPMILLFYCLASTTLLSIFIILSALIGSLNGFNQTCLRKLLMFSSINHIGWMLSLLTWSFNSWLIYFSIYTFININIIFLLNLNKIYFFNQINKISFNKSTKFFFLMNLFSLGGLPPFIGFFIKWITVNELVFNKMFALALILIFLTLLALFFYTRLTFSTLTMTAAENLPIFINSPPLLVSISSFVSLSAIVLCFSFISLI
uniref:NADH dehydrogenase subunit 2 n=1 Tax=Orthotomicus erosus TaxID=55869 RepID=UPI001EE0A74E|nr:NADH dehydrogenase subunit 2 [Orthotomicus erosus]UJX85635.1 NADH dehydrogenase subunit 2 [Orthotomicus erosus]